MRRYVFLFAICFSVFNIISLSSAQIGVSPGYYNIDFKPGLKTNMYFDFTEDKNLPLEVFVEGDLAEYVKLSTNKLNGDGSVGVALSLPNKIDIPGTHIIYVGARQVTDEESGFGIVGSIKGMIRVKVPYPGQYATIKVESINANVGEGVDITATIDNLGIEEVEAYGKIGIYGNGRFVTDFTIENMHLSSPQQSIAKFNLDTTNYASGNYLAVGELQYGDGKIAKGNSSFRLGELSVKIENYTKTVQRDKINKFDINIASEWNDKIDGVYANVTLKNSPISFLTPSVSMDNFGKSTLTGFFDTTGIEGESFEAILKIHYSEKTTEEVVVLTFEKKPDYLLISIIGAIILVILCIAIVSYYLRKNGKKRR